MRRLPRDITCRLPALIERTQITVAELVLCRVLPHMRRHLRFLCRGAGGAARRLAVVALKEEITQAEGKQKSHDGKPENLAPHAVHFLVYAAVHAYVAGALIVLCRCGFLRLFLPLVLVPFAGTVAVKVRLKGLNEFRDFLHICHTSHPALCSMVTFSCSLTRSCARSNGASMM